MMTKASRAVWPRTEDLAFDPELAPLALLDAALAIAVQALIAKNPDMLCEHAQRREAPHVAAALHIVALYRQMHDALDEYRSLLPQEPSPYGYDEIPF